MTETDELRRLLDERGVIWGNVRNDGSESKYLTEWQFDGNQGRAVATEWAVGSGLSMEIRRYHLTTEQAIAATLGAGTCRMEPVKDYPVGECAIYSFGCVCSACSSFFEYTRGRNWHFCPNCGRKVVTDG